MIALLILGFLLIFIAVILLLCPRILLNASEFLNRKIFDENAIFSHRLLIALMCFALGTILLLQYSNHHLNISRLFNV